VLAVRPMDTTMEWITENDCQYSKNLSTFASSDVQHVDSAFEFVFLNLSLRRYAPTDLEKETELKVGPRLYLVLPIFVSNSATSFEKFTNDVREIIETVDGLNDRIIVSAMHPEHVDESKRSPQPVVVLQWFDEVE
jgi:hypothetical protein